MKTRENTLFRGNVCVQVLGLFVFCKDIVSDNICRYHSIPALLSLRLHCLLSVNAKPASRSDRSTM